MSEIVDPRYLEVDPSEVKRCPECLGRVYSPHCVCGGAGLVFPWEPAHAYEVWEEDCLCCGGAGEHTCRVCHGTPVRRVPRPYLGETACYGCYICDRRGRVKCRRCKGTGHVWRSNFPPEEEE